MRALMIVAMTGLVGVACGGPQGTQGQGGGAATGGGSPTGGGAATGGSGHAGGGTGGSGGGGHAVCDAGQPADIYATAQPFECNESLQRLPTRDAGITLPFDLVMPAAAAPRGVVILLPGGAGVLSLSATGIEQAADNFCVRTRQLYATQGFAVAVPDAPSDRPTGLDDFRATKDHADDLTALITWLRNQFPGVPVTVVGTSRGTISAANVAVRFSGSQGPDYLVLTSSVTSIPASATDQEDIQSIPGYRAALMQRAPILMIDDSLDACGASKPANAMSFAATIDDSAAFVVLDGGPTPPDGGDVCGGLAYHGFYGLDAPVVDRIIEFIDAGT